MKNIKVKLVWFDQRDGHGIAQDTDKNEYYIDSSVIKFDVKELTSHNGTGISKTGLDMVIDINQSIKNCLCGKNVRLA